MNAIHSANPSRLENIRKMLLAMADDVRVVLIKLAEKLRILRTVAHLGDSIKQKIAHEAMDVYAPLANRLGVGQIKWEMEDLAFRYLQPNDYKTIAKGLNLRRVERDKYVTQIVDILNQQMHEHDIQGANIYGRSKHILSIHRKMQRKNVNLEHIYDATAVRILVNSIDDCYQALSIVHHLWQQIPEEFDDYIQNPKGNGYRSLHTAVIGPNGLNFEVQIRTFQMHDEAELGIAAHWKYKEGASSKESQERKIEWLRQVLAWQKEIAQNEEISQQINMEYLDDRIYVFTPQGDIIDLPHGATPIDFAYHIHSEVGHRCRGAKIDGKIIQLTHALKTGDQVEILTTNQAKPTRDWLNPHLGYVKSPRAKAKIMHWFKLQDFDKNRQEGQETLDKEVRKLGLKKVNFDKVAKSLHFKKADDLFAAIGSNDIRLSQVIHVIQPPAEKNPEEVLRKTEKSTHRAQTKKLQDNIVIEGVGNLLTNIARCCKPIPGDEVIGYITRGRGVSVHRKDCSNILHANAWQQERLIEVAWGENQTQRYPIDIEIIAYDRSGLLSDITTLLTNERAHVLSLNSHIDKNENEAYLRATIEVVRLDVLSRLLDKIKQLPNIADARRIDE